MSFRIESSNGVTEAGYQTRAAAQKAADRANRQAPEQCWRPVPEWCYDEKQEPAKRSWRYEPD